MIFLPLSLKSLLSFPLINTLLILLKSVVTINNEINVFQKLIIRLNKVKLNKNISLFLKFPDGAIC